ncbi:MULTISPECIES: collagenase [unclassified Endozoicomonas]|uniref:collagenase n=1 Tax=unclassified Endozoicomonas TaxID=2644528 RepID=UPI003BB7EA4F
MKHSLIASLFTVVIINLTFIFNAHAITLDFETRVIHGRQIEEILDGKPLPPNNPHQKVRDFLIQEKLSQLAVTRGLTCTPESFAALGGQQLTEAIRKAELACINNLFSVTGIISSQLFSQDKMITVANEVTRFSQNYTGDNSEGLQQLILYLRAGYYVQFYQPDTVGDYDSRLASAMQQALDSFFANPNAFAVSDKNGEVLSEAVTLIDSSAQNTRYIFVIKRLLTSYNQEFEASRNMTIAVNNGMTVLFRGHQLKPFVTAIERDTTLLDDLYNFYNTKQHLLGTDNEYLLVNVVRELGRFVQHNKLQPKVSGQLNAILSQQNNSEKGTPLWLVAAEIASYYDNENCEHYGICNFKEEVENNALVFNHTCSKTLKVRSQNMTVAQAEWICDQLSEQEEYFHNKLRTNFQPVANDLNDDLELVIFNTAKDYKMYAGLLFNISTDNGGMYLEGAPEKPDNQARFIAYEADWLRPEFHVWNLRHEYVHYLDGRFNMAGDFRRSTSTDTIWWIEGLGEYISHRNEYPEAVSLARTKQYPLSTVFRNSYSSGTTLIYRWGYLAVRFMFERHPSEISEMLSLTRSNDYKAYRAWIDRIGKLHDDEWYGWLDTVESTDNQLSDYGPRDDDSIPDNGDDEPAIPDTPVTDTPVTDHDIENSQLHNKIPKVGLSSGKNPYFYIYIPSGTRSLIFTIDGRSGNGELEILIRPDQWPSDSEYEFSELSQGDRKSININPLKTGTYYYVMVKGKGQFSCIELMASYN